MRGVIIAILAFDGIGFADCKVPYSWPQRVTPDNLAATVFTHATRVGTAVAPTADLDPAQRAWEANRDATFQRLSDTIRAVSRDPRLDINMRRDRMCGVVKAEFVDHTYEGGVSNVFAHCGEAGFTYYCYAHQARMTDLMVCSSAWDHVFALVRGPGQELCILDRWNLAKRPEQNAFYYCSADLAIRGGVVVLPGGVPSREPMYQYVNCSDPVRTGAPRIDVSLATWDHIPTAAEASASDRKMRSWTADVARHPEVTERLSGQMEQAHTQMVELRNRLYCPSFDGMGVFALE